MCVWEYQSCVLWHGYEGLDDWILRFRKRWVVVSRTAVRRPPSSMLELRDRPSDFWFRRVKIDFYGRHTFCVTAGSHFRVANTTSYGLSSDARMTTRAASVRKILLSGNWCVWLSMPYSSYICKPDLKHGDVQEILLCLRLPDLSGSLGGGSQLRAGLWHFSLSLSHFSW